MPATTAETPTKAYTFADIAFTVPQPYAAGAVLTAPEAAFLNQSIASRVGNGYGGEVRRALTLLNAERAAQHKAKTYAGPTVTDDKGRVHPAPATTSDLTNEDGTPWDHASKFASRYADFIVGESNRGSGTSVGSTPLNRLMRTLASEDVKSRIIARGLKVQDFMRAKVTVDGETISKFEDLVSKNLTTQDERFRSMAQSQLDQLAGGVEDDLLEGLDIS